MAPRVSLGLLVPLTPKDTLDKNRRKSANARLTTDTRNSGILQTGPSEELGSSLHTPLIIDSDDEKDDRATARSQKASMTGPGTRLLATPKQNNGSTPRSATNSRGRSDPTLTTECESGPQKHVSFCGASYTRLGNLRNHEKGCTVCKAEQNKENSATKDHSELSDGIKKLSTRTPRISGANELSDCIYQCDQVGGDSKTNGAQQGMDQGNKSTTHLISSTLSNRAMKRLVNTDEKGHVYILRDPETNHMKIGCTKDLQTRINQHEKCGRDLKLIHLSKFIPWIKRAEKLIKDDLRHLQRPWFCIPCNRSHDEFFQVTEEKAKEIVNRWAEWIIDCNPYDMDKELTPLWNYLITFGRPPAKEIATHDHEARWAHWDWVLSKPSKSDLAAFDMDTQRAGIGRSEKKTPRRQRISNGPTYITHETLDATDENDPVDQTTFEILGQAAEAIAQTLKGKKDYMTMDVTFRIECYSGKVSVKRVSQ